MAIELGIYKFWNWKTSPNFRLQLEWISIYVSRIRCNFDRSRLFLKGIDLAGHAISLISVSRRRLIPESALRDVNEYWLPGGGEGSCVEKNRISRPQASDSKWEIKRNDPPPPPAPPLPPPATLMNKNYNYISRARLLRGGGKRKRS